MLSHDTQKEPFWRLSAEKAADLLETDIHSGLSDDEAKRRRVIFGGNTLEHARRSPGLRIFLRQFQSPLIIVLIIASALTLLIEHYRDTFFILTAVVVNALLGFYQEYKADKALAELTTYLRQRARVIRAGAEREIDADFLVPGDIIRLAQGDRVPADARLLFVNDLQIDEAILTGESLPASKSVEPSAPDAPLGDQNSMAFAGTLITQGVATAVVARTDSATEIGKIASLVAASEREETPLQKSIRIFSIRSSIILTLLTLVVFVIGILAGRSFLEMFLTSIAVAVAAIPEGLPVAMTVILAVGVERMARRKGVVRKLVAAEALGSATLILTDKTGTLTQALLELSGALPSEGLDEHTLFTHALFNTNVLIENPGDQPSEWRMSGRVLETALVRAAGVRGMHSSDLAGSGEVLQTLPFNSANKFSASLVLESGGQHRLLFFGAPDILVSHSALGEAAKAEVLAQIDELAASGERVLGVASKAIEPKKDFSFESDTHLVHVSFDGLLTFRDPVRPGVPHAIRSLEQAGIRVAVVTGDHRGTAEAIARDAGLDVPKGASIDAEGLSKISDAELDALLPRLQVFARVTPEDKVRILEAFQRAGEVVAMTGDGVNDAPSIKLADVGIAMGSGTEVSRGVADLVLLDDNFETIAAAVDEGRQIMNNIRKVIVYLFSSVADGLFLIGGALLTGVPLPLNALQILWVNFFSDSFPAVAFAFEKGIDGLARRSHRPSKNLFDPVMRFLILVVGVVTSASLFGLYWFLLRAGFDETLVRTFAFACFGTYTLFLPFALRSLEKGITEYPLFSNPFLVAGTGIGGVLMLLAVYMPFLQGVLDTVPLPLPWFLGVVAVGVVNIIFVELAKYFFRRRHEVRRTSSSSAA